MRARSSAVRVQQEADSPQASSPKVSASSLARSNPGIANYIGIFCTAGAVLLLELGLTRIFAVLLWAHLAFMVVGSALFGFGLSGVYLALRRAKQSESLRSELCVLSLAMSAAMLVCYAVVTNVPFEMWNFQEDSRNFYFLAIWYASLVVPFFLAGLIVAKLLSAYSEHSDKLYGVDLIGAAAGSLLLIPLIPQVGGEGTVAASAVLAAIAALAYAPAQRRVLRATAALAVIALCILVPKAQEVLPLEVHATKRRFNTAARYNHIYDTRWSTLSRVDIAYHKKDILDIWIDGGTNESAILKWNGNLAETKPLRFSTIGTSYALKQGKDPRVMIIGPAGGKEVLFALSHGASHVDAVEMDPSIVQLVNEERYSKYMGGLYQHEKVSLHNDEGRSFLRRQEDGTYDIIQSVNNYTPVAMNAGALNLSAAFLMTKEAVNDYLDHLTPDGVLALHRGAALRILITMLEVLHERGVENPENHILISSGEVPYFDGIYLKKSPWTEPEVARVTEYLEGRPLQEGRMYLWNPIRVQDSDPLYKKVAQTSPDNMEQYYKSYGVRLSPPTDDKPFIEHFLLFGKQDLSPELPAEFRFREDQKWRGIIPRGEFPYLAILAESALLSLVFVAVPLLLFARKSVSQPGFRGLLAYFAALGFGFIVIEICLMKKYVLFLGNPAYSITTVLVVLLCGAGIGSMLSGKIFPKNAAKALTLVVPLVAAAALVEAYVSPLIFENYLRLEFPFRVAIASALLLPLGVVMGTPFPIGLRLIRQTSKSEEQLRKATAWAWGMNGYFTVIGSASTVFIAVFAGFTAALLTAITAYLLGMIALRISLSSQ